jgi:hypothetical protein
VKYLKGYLSGWQEQEHGNQLNNQEICARSINCILQRDVAFRMA